MATAAGGNDVAVDLIARRVAAVAAGGTLALSALGTPARAEPAAGGQGGGGQGGGGTTLAGYTADTVAAGARVELDSPGLLPVGNPEKGEIVEADLPFARISVASGPVVDALASPLYPGDTAAHLGTAIATFGGPPLPNDPAVAEAQYPPSPGHSTQASFRAAPVGGAPGGPSGSDSESTAGAGGAGAGSTTGGFDITNPGSPTPLLHVSASSATSSASFTDTAVSTAATTVAGVTVAGLVHIDGLSSAASATSDGSRGSPRAELHVGRVTAGGQSAWIDQSGLHVAGGPGQGGAAVRALTDQLNAALAGAGVKVSAVAPRLTSKDGAATATSGAILVTIERRLPAVGVPGVPALTVPGLPPVPLGTPGVPLEVTVALGGTAAGVNATTAPGLGPLGGLGPAGVTGPMPTSAPTAGLAGVPGAAGALSGPGSSAASAVEGAAAGDRLPAGVPVPVVLIIGGVLAALAVGLSILGYARWQLLAGRAGGVTR